MDAGIGQRENRKDKLSERTREAQKEVERQSDARANNGAVTLQVLHDKPPFKQ